MGINSLSQPNKQHFIAEKRQPFKITKPMLAKILLINSLGYVYNDVLLFRISNFAATLPYIVIALTAISIILSVKRFNQKIALVLMLMICIEIVHATFFGFITEIQWLKSFSLFLFCSSAFLLVTGLRLDRDTIIKIAQWTVKIGIIIGVAGILQFILLNNEVPAHLPLSLSAAGFDPHGVNIFRTGSYASAFGLAMEPSYYGIGLNILIACILFFYNADIIKNSKLFFLSIIVLLGGILVSFSLAGILMACIILLVQVICYLPNVFEAKRLKFISIISTIVIGISVSGFELIKPIKERMLRAVMGSDSSAQMRVIASTRYLFTTETSLEFFLLGTGIGMSMRDYDLHQQIYIELSPAGWDWSSVKVHNVLAVIRMLQGWIGLLLFGSMVWIIFRPLAGKWKAFSPLVVLFILLNFSSGIYLSPPFWASLGLIYVLRRYYVIYHIRKNSNLLRDHRKLLTER